MVRLLRVSKNTYSKYENYSTSSEGLKIEIDFFGPDENTLQLLSRKATKNIGEYILNRVKTEIPGILAAGNFYGEAEEYMSRKKIPFSPKTRALYAEAIRNDFMNALHLSVQYREEDGMLYISPYVFSLEYGDFYRPALNFLSNCINDWVKELTNKEFIDDVID